MLDDTSTAAVPMTSETWPPYPRRRPEAMLDVDGDGAVRRDPRREHGAADDQQQHACRQQSPLEPENPPQRHP
jgi:hypothetical protein